MYFEGLNLYQDKCVYDFYRALICPQAQSASLLGVGSPNTTPKSSIKGLSPFVGRT